MRRSNPRNTLRSTTPPPPPLPPPTLLPSQSNEQTITNTDRASQAILDLVQKKQREVEETMKIRQLSVDMVHKLRQLSQGMQALTENSASVRKTLENWEVVFNTMGEMNTQEQNATWVRFQK
ncbi:uncharacterized protein B0P05DRAFT_535872 [Gilbertella persicaria]|uniref:uncharacterized protein n=1 Tax=Gilbertella persicaria TaxID=101096 RepID=UPI00221FA8FD|nr:uncharacterized protein B0P05DRAFT_535872 [Gilbertella persicaria]KAI8084021.1 hypothetical protein B0P05DRAFT_535872 [Gilbertella persicaria]